MCDRLEINKTHTGTATPRSQVMVVRANHALENMLGIYMSQNQRLA